MLHRPTIFLCHMIPSLATIMPNVDELITAMVSTAPIPSRAAAEAVTMMHHPRAPPPSILTFHNDQSNNNSTSCTASSTVPSGLTHCAGIQKFPTNSLLAKGRHKELCHDFLCLTQIFSPKNHPGQHNLEEKSAWIFIIEEI